jgi:signal peptidase I
MPLDREYREVLAIRRRHPSRDAVEGFIGAIILLLILRHFVFEVFKIPTGSMAPTLLGQHRDLPCPNCDYRFAVDGGQTDEGLVKAIRARCPNCGYDFSDYEILSRVCDCFPSWPRRFFWRGDNRVMVNKFLWMFRPLKRWDVVVFKFPEADYRCLSCGAIYRADPKNGPVRCPECGSALRVKASKTYIKRLIALPGEETFVRHGDIYINNALARKPRDVQETLWRMVYDSRYVPKAPEPGFSPRWEGLAGTFEAPGKALQLRPGDDGDAAVKYGPRIDDFVAYNGWQGEVYLNVGDLRWKVRVRTDGPAVVRLEIREDDVQYVASIPFGDGGAEATITANGVPVAAGPFSADPRAAHEISFANWDDTLLLTVDGRDLLSAEHPVAASPECYESDASLAVTGGRATFEHVRLERDLYYMQRFSKDRPLDDRVVARVPPEGYYFMGDNTRNSYDSRYWGTAPVQNLVGRAVVVWWPLDRLRATR